MLQLNFNYVINSIYDRLSYTCPPTEPLNEEKNSFVKFNFWSNVKSQKHIYHCAFMHSAVHRI